MALCSYSSNLSMDGLTSIENTFISEFLPQAPENAVKVYLYGRFLCSTPHEDDNSLNSMSVVLSLSEDEIISAFSYWQEMGLVTIVNNNPIEVKFLPIKLYTGSGKIRNKEKYAEFNAQAQEILSGRQITPNEFNEYYTLIETYHFEPEALLMIIKYCTMLKSSTINYPYILTVAKSFERENIKTTTAIEEKLQEQERSSAEIKAVLAALGIKREADVEERNMYIKWTSGLGFTQNVILYAAKNQGKTGGMHKLDATLVKYFELKLFTIEEIETYAKTRDNLYTIAKEVTRTIGQYYQVLDGVVENYVTKWVQKGYSKETLNLIANYCLTSNLRTLEAVDDVISKFFKLGLISIESINQYLDEILNTNSKIKEILELCGLLRNVNSADRELYKTWHNDWQISDEIIYYVAKQCKNRDYPTSAMNKLLGEIYNKKLTSIKEVEELIKNQNQAKPAIKPEQPKFKQREYSSNELNALFDSLDDVEI
ncbi:MAG: DnaD domain protein [bacterium]|nr:DnaD domain protein [bacterium]